MEKYRDGQKELHCVFVDLEKAYDRVPREELWYCMRKSGVAEKYVRVVQDMYERSRTVVRCAVGQTEEFNVEVGLHQGLALSPFLFAIVMDQLSEEVRQESPWTMMFADDIVIWSESREQVEENLERWRFALERRGMKVSRSKTEYMCVNEREGSGTVRLQGEEVKKVQEFKYLGSTVQSNGECGKEVKKRVQAETVSLRKRQESELEVAELKMLREARLRWFGHVQRRDSEYIGRRMLDMELPGRRQRGRPKRSSGLSAASGWNEQALITTYRQGLNPRIQLHLAAYEDSIGLEKFIQLSIRVASHMQLCFEEHQDQSLSPAAPRRPEHVSCPEPADEPMDLEHSDLAALEPRTLLDSGSAWNFISGALCHQLHLKRTATQKVYQIHVVTGRTLQTVRHLAGPLRLQVGALHSEELHLLVLEDATTDIILGRPWLEHDPVLSWKTGEILKWGEHCFGACFPSLPAPVPPQVYHLLTQATSVESPPEARPPDIPACYSHFRDVFCPRKASKLPPHRPWDCAIDLIPGEPVPKGRIYSLSIPEEKAMEEYIQEALAQGYIRPSTSPAASSFFFVAKKDSGLRPCIDYRALNQITVKFSAYNLIRIREGDEWKTAFVTLTGHYEYLVMPYGLANAPSVFQDFMHTAEKCAFHQSSVHFLGYIIDRRGVRMDERKVAAVRDWPPPTTIKEL
ncbi:hypothetical protein QTP70_002998 [Hemibagrus guttatus]|uniref:ribonuclease H n=1 Tax=Hemibagrus guttatus TaxID=175788 RepID=A0AAE0R597_9TELE|nr:hypothetical protein QTP70_002998 [Hemibagrus guttatus]